MTSKPSVAAPPDTNQQVKVISLLTHDGIHHLPEIYAEKTWTVDL